jgi:hypothetical protein
MTMEWIAFGASALTAICALLGTYLSNRKQTALMDYRLKQLEDKVGKHNNLEGRIITLETQMKDYHHVS